MTAETAETSNGGAFVELAAVEAAVVETGPDAGHDRLDKEETGSDAKDEGPSSSNGSYGGGSAGSGGGRCILMAHFFAFAAAIVLFAAATALHGGNSSSVGSGTADQRTRSVDSAHRLLKKRKPNKAEADDDPTTSGGASASASAEQQKYIPPEEIRRLLDFAIVGFPKTGTSFMEHYLFNQDEELHLDSREHCLGKEDNFDALTNLVNLYGFEIDKVTEDGIHVKNAIKCPHELLGEFNLGNYEKYLPEIKFIVSTRHPVLYFQSWYNYKLRQTNKHKKGTIWAPPTKDLIGACAEGTPYHYGAPNKLAIKERKNVCTDGAKFHHALSRFGKTPMNTPEELELLDHHEMSVHDMPKSEVFIMELDQFKVDSPEEEELAKQFLVDMKNYLGLQHDLPPLYHHESKPVREEVEEYVIDICDEEHDMVRGELIEAGKDAYVWIRDFFVDSPGVVVSNREHFLSLVEKWQYDPCDSAEE